MIKPLLLLFCLQLLSSCSGTIVCSNTCRYARDGDCDDGGANAHYSVCGLGTDCADCGRRDGASSSPVDMGTVSSSGDELQHDGMLYRTMTAGLVDSEDNECQSDYIELPSGWQIAPDTEATRSHVIAQHYWSTHVLIVNSGKGYETK